MKKILTILITLIVGAAVAAGAIFYIQAKGKPVVDAKALMERLEESSELTLEKSYYTGIVRFSEGSVPLITKNSFNMKYDAVVEAGFELDQVTIEVTDTQVIVTVPEAKVLSINIDPDSLEFYDNKTSIIKTDRKEATKKALQEAQKDAEKNAVKKGVIEAADKRAEVVFKGILEGGVAGREIVVVRAGDAAADEGAAGDGAAEDEAAADEAGGEAAPEGSETEAEG